MKFVFLITLCTVLTPLLTVGIVENNSEKMEIPLSEPETMVSENHLLQLEPKQFDKNTMITLYTQGECREIDLQEYLTGVLAVAQF